MKQNERADAGHTRDLAGGDSLGCCPTLFEISLEKVLSRDKPAGRSFSPAPAPTLRTTFALH